MHRLLAAALTCVVAAGLAVGAGFGIVAALNAAPEQPNVPLVHFHSSPDEVPGLGESASPSASPSGSASPSRSGASHDSGAAERSEESPGGDDGGAASSASPGAAGSSRGADEPAASATPRG